MRSRGMPSMPRIDRRDMQFELAEEFGVVQIPKNRCRSIARSGASICRIMAGVVDRAIFVGQRFRQGHQIGLVAVVMLIEHRRGDDAR